MADRGTQHKRAVEFLLGGDLLLELTKFVLARGERPQVLDGGGLVAHGRQVNVSLVHIGSAHLKEPHLGGCPVEAQRVGLLRRAAHVEVLQIDGLRHIGLRAVLITARTLRAVLVLVAGNVGGAAQRQARQNLETGADLDALVHLVHTGEGVVHKGGGQVIIEGGALGGVTLVGKERGHHSLEAAQTQGVTQVGAEHLLAVEVGDGIVLGARRDVGVVGQRGVSAVVDVARERVAAVQFIGGAGLEGHVHELVVASAALGVLGRAAVAHLAVALEVGVTGLDGVVDVPVGEVDHHLLPDVGVHRVDIVVISEAVALVDLAVGVVHIVLGERGVAGEVTLGILVDVQPVGATQQIFHGLIVTGHGVAGAHAALQGHLVVKAVVERAVELPHGQIAVTLLDDVGRALVLAGALGLEGVEVVHLIHTLPVELAHVFAVAPQVGVELIGVRVAGKVTGQVTVVVRTRVAGVVPVEGAAGVERLVESDTGVERRTGLGRPHPVEDGGGVKGLHHAGVALLALLPAPVGIIKMCTGQVVGLLKGRAVAGALGGGAKGGQRQRVLRVEHLLDGEEVAPAVVERAFDDALVGVASHGAGGDRPAVLHQAGGVGGHAAPLVVAVGVGHAAAEARGIVLGKGADVVGTADAAKAVTRRRQAHTD